MKDALGSELSELLYTKGITEICTVEKHRRYFPIKLFSCSLYSQWDEMDTEATGERSFSDSTDEPFIPTRSITGGCWSRWPLWCFTLVMCIWWGLFSLHLIIHQRMRVCMNTNPSWSFPQPGCILALFYKEDFFSLCCLDWKKVFPLSENYGAQKSTQARFDSSLNITDTKGLWTFHELIDPYWLFKWQK